MDAESVDERVAAGGAVDDAGITLDKSEVVYEDAYARHFKMVLRAVLHERPDLRKLYSPQELAIAAAFLEELQPMEQQLYARLFQRKGPWFKTTSLFQYLLKKPYVPRVSVGEGVGDADDEGKVNDKTIAQTVEDGNGDAIEAAAEEEATSTATDAIEQVDNAVVQKALQALIRIGFLVTLPIGVSTAPATFFGAAAPSSATKQQDQELALARSLEALQQCASAPELASLQKKLTGSKAKKKSSPSSASSNGSSTPWSSKTEAFQAVKKVVMTQRRIDGSRIPLASLMHQIFLDSYPLRGKSKSDVLVVQMPDTHRDLFHRMHRLFYFQSRLPFNRSASGQPNAGKSEKEALETAVMRLQQDATQWPGLMVIFRKVAYPKYELNIQHHLFPSPEAYVCYEVASRLHFVLGMVEQQLLIEIPEGHEPDLDIKWMAFDSTPQLLAFQKLIETDDDGFEILPDALAASSDSPPTPAEAIDWQVESWTQFRVKLSEMTSLDDFVLESRRCFHAFLLWTKSLSHLSESTSPPVFFSKCNAGYHLARVLHHAVSLYEKQRQYQVAILLLNDLLESPFLQRKRGHWWERLALNLEHLKCVDQARSTCTNALKDEHVFGTDRITLSRRMKRLQKGVTDDYFLQQQERKRRDRDDDDFVSLLSDDDDEAEGGRLTQDDAKAATGPLAEEYAYPKEHIVGRPLNRQTAEKSRFIGYDDEPCTVEQLVLQYYRSQRKSSDSVEVETSKRGGWYGVHCEGRVMTNLFGLCMWDILYASVADVFQTRFQSYPLDFGYADAFYSSRRDLIDTRLRQLEHEWSMLQILESIETTYTREYGNVSRFVSWSDESYLPLQFHQLVVVAMGQQRLAKLMRYMLTSPEYHRAQNGLPDLLMLQAEPCEASDNKDGDEGVPLPVDETGCLDIYAFCSMTYQTNLNGKTEETTSTVKIADEDPDAAEQTTAAKTFLDQLKRWEVQLKLVEVKGPRDRLSDKQTHWLQVLNEEVGVETAVTHVVEDEKTLEKMRNPVVKKVKMASAKSKAKKSVQLRSKGDSVKKSAKRQKK